MPASHSAAGAVAALIRRGAHSEALARCVESFGADLGRFCMALLRDQAQSEETLLELMVAFYDAMPRLDERSLRPYLYATARELCHQRLSTHTHQEGTSNGGPEGPGVELAALKPLERDVALLRFMAGLSYEEIGEICELPPEEAAKRAGRALLNLRQLALERGSAT